MSLIRLGPTALRIALLLTDHGFPVIVLSDVVWIRSDLIRFQLDKFRDPQDAAYSKIGLMYVV